MFRQICVPPSTTFSSARICDTQDLFWPADDKEPKKAEVEEKEEVGSNFTTSTRVEEKSEKSEKLEKAEKADKPEKKNKKKRKRRDGVEVAKGKKKECLGTGLFD